MSEWPTALLCDIADIRHGGTPSKAKAEYWNGKIPWVSPKDFISDTITDTVDHISDEAVTDSATSVVPPETILIVARSGILARRVPVASCTVPVAFNQDIKAIIPRRDQIAPEYLAWFLRSREPQLLAQGVKRGATVHSLHSRFVEHLQIPIPPFDEQRRIVDILNRANGILRLRREAQEKARQLIPALFVKMFGDPAQNSKGFNVSLLGELVAAFQGGRNLRTVDSNGASSRFRILKVSAVTSGEFQLAEAKPAPAGYTPPPAHLVRRGDFLFSRANTVDLVGATAIVSETTGNILLPDKLWRLIWRDQAPIVPKFALAFFKHPSTRRRMGMLATGTSDSMRNISQKKLRTLPVPLPPLDLQQIFATHVLDIQSIIEQQDRMAAASERLVDSLMHRMFEGN